MSEPFIGEISIFGCAYPPKDWAYCNGQIVPISENHALYAILGTIYGGDGYNTMGLPNLQDRAPMHHGEGVGLTPRTIGEYGGEYAVTLTTNEMPQHTHEIYAINYVGSSPNPTGTFLGVKRGVPVYATDTTNFTPMSSSVLKEAGGSQSHNNIQPSLCMNYCIALEGIFPPRN